jgi:hypothetical protein
MNEKEGGAPLNEAPEARTQSKTLNRLNSSTNVSISTQPAGPDTPAACPIPGVRPHAHPAQGKATAVPMETMATEVLSRA